MIVQYSMVIRWSEEDQVFVASFPEFGEYAQTHGATYEEAARNGREVLELLLESFQVEGQPLPAPHFYDASTKCVGEQPRQRQTTNP
jgi:predicted RNase H-like HicB family nuclease